MKRLLLLVFALVCYSGSLYSQVDNQWYILNGMGRDNISFPIPVTSKITIDTIQLPTTSTTVTPKDNIFLIWSDWTHYNSRYQSAQPFIYNPPHFYINSGNNKNIRYLYWANIYDDNPPPKKIKVINDNSASNPNIFLPTTSYPSLNRIYANHNAIPVTDQVLILNGELLKNKPASLSFSVKHGATVTPLSSAKNYVHLQPVFPGMGQAGSAFSHGNAVYSNNQISLTPHSFNAFYYLALTMNDSLSLLFSGNEVPDSLLYTLSNGNNVISTGIEPIHDSDDPNVIIATEFAKANGKFYVHYKGDFFNSSNRVAADKLKFGFKIRRGFYSGLNLHNLVIKHKNTMIQGSTVDIQSDGSCEVALPLDVRIMNTSLEEATINFDFYIGPFDSAIVNRTDSLISGAYTEFNNNRFKRFPLTLRDETYHLNLEKESKRLNSIEPRIVTLQSLISDSEQSFCEKISAWFHINCWLLLALIVIAFVLIFRLRRRQR
jgi:hypothetical protein